jgi:hypothetical protein
MLNSVKKIRASRDRKIDILSCQKKKILNETKNRNPPSTLQVKLSDPYLTFDLNKIGLPTATRGRRVHVRQVGGFSRELQFPPPIKLTATT